MSRRQAGTRGPPRSDSEQVSSPSYDEFTIDTNMLLFAYTLYDSLTTVQPAIVMTLAWHGLVDTLRLLPTVLPSETEPVMPLNYKQRRRPLTMHSRN